MGVLYYLVDWDNKFYLDLSKVSPSIGDIEDEDIERISKDSLLYYLKYSNVVVRYIRNNPKCRFSIETEHTFESFEYPDFILCYNYEEENEQFFNSTYNPIIKPKNFK